MRYAAIGDSFTEGVGDELPDGAVRGWADRLAAALATARGETVSYANLAVRGRLLGPILTEQLDAALALDPTPTLITLNGGGNDMLRPRVAVADLVDLTARAVGRCRDAGVRLVLLSGADPSVGLPLGHVVRRRGEALTAGITALAHARDVDLVDVFHDAEVRRSPYWSPDRLHLNARGHERVAGLVLTALTGAAATAPTESWPESGSTTVRGPRSELRYYREHVVPWGGRRVRGHSSGDGRDGKHPGWVPVAPGGLAPPGAAPDQ